MRSPFWNLFSIFSGWGPCNFPCFVRSHVSTACQLEGSCERGWRARGWAEDCKGSRAKPLVAGGADAWEEVRAVGPLARPHNGFAGYFVCKEPGQKFWRSSERQPPSLRLFQWLVARRTWPMVKGACLGQSIVAASLWLHESTVQGDLDALALWWWVALEPPIDRADVWRQGPGRRRAVWLDCALPLHKECEREEESKGVCWLCPLWNGLPPTISPTGEVGCESPGGWLHVEWGVQHQWFAHGQRSPARKVASHSPVWQDPYLPRCHCPQHGEVLLCAAASCQDFKPGFVWWRLGHRILVDNLSDVNWPPLKQLSSHPT